MRKRSIVGKHKFVSLERSAKCAIVAFLYESKEENNAVICLREKIPIPKSCLFLSKNKELPVVIWGNNRTLRQLRQLRQNSATDVLLTGEKELDCAMMWRRCTITISPELFFLLKKENLHVEKTVKPILSATNLAHFWRSWRAQLAQSSYIGLRRLQSLILYGVHGGVIPFPGQC
jgi:hypothetical protein